MIRNALFMILLCAATLASADSCKLNASDEKEITALPGQYRDAWLLSDAQKQVMKLFVVDAVILPAQGTQPSAGKDKIAAWWWPPNARPFEILEFTMKTQRTSGCGKVAYAWGTQTLQWRYTGESKVTYQAGTFLMVFRKQPDGHWQVASFMWDDQPYVTK